MTIDTYLANIHSPFAESEFYRSILDRVNPTTDRECTVALLSYMHTLVDVLRHDATDAELAASLIDGVDDLVMMLCESDLMTTDDAIRFLHVANDVPAFDQWYETMRDNAPSDEWDNTIMNAYVGARHGITR